LDKFIAWKNGERVCVDTTYDDIDAKGIIIQLASTETSIQAYHEECVFLKSKNYSLERILRTLTIPRFNDGRRPRLPNHNVSEKYTIIHIGKLILFL